MNTPLTPRPQEEQLDGFELALLHELQEVSRDQARPGPSPAGPSPTDRFRRRRWVLPLGAAAAGAVVLALVQPLGAGSPAFAVTEQDGQVTVEINRLEGPQALEEALAEHGITAVVDYPEPGTQCSPGRYQQAPPSGDGSGTTGATGTSAGGQGGDAGDGAVFSMTLDPADYTGRTLVLEAVWFDDVAFALSSGVAQGPVGPCDPVPSDLLQELDPQQVEGPGADTGVAPSTGP